MNNHELLTKAVKHFLEVSGYNDLKGKIIQAVLITECETIQMGTKNFINLERALEEYGA